MFDMKRRESLRCLFASVASITIMDWLLETCQVNRIIAAADDIEDKLVNIRSFFLVSTGLSREDVRQKFIPMGSALSHHIYEVLFADAIRWWAAAHHGKQDKNKYLRQSMYKGEFATLSYHFYHEFRNNQLAHFPGRIKDNDNPLLTPSPYGLFLSPKEYQDFRSVLTHSIKLTLLGAEKLESLWDGLYSPVVENDELSPEQKKAAIAALTKVLGDFDEELLRMPTRNHFPDSDDV